MKKIFSVITLIIIVSSLLCIPVSAESESAQIYDGAGYLTESEFEEISGMLEEVRAKYGVDVVIYTEAEELPGNLTVDNHAKSIYDEKGYGSEKNEGILLYVSSGSREYCLDNHARGMITANGEKYLENKVVPFLKDDAYADAFKAYAQYSEELLEMAANGEPFDEKQYSRSYLLTVIGLGILIPLLLAFIMMKIKLGKMNTAVAQNYASNYMKEGSFHLDVNQDIFLYSNIVKKEKPKDDSSSDDEDGGHSTRSGSF